MPNQPPAQTDQWLHITDFSAGCINYAETSGQGAHRFDPAPPGAADPAETYSCIALPSGGLGALPEQSNTYEWNGISVGGQTAYLVGFLVHDELANNTTEAFVIVEFDDGFTHHYDVDSYIVETNVITNILTDSTPTNPGIFGAPYPALTRVNLTQVAGVTVTSGNASLTVSSGGFPGAVVGGTVIVYSVTSGTPVIPLANVILSIVGNTLTIDNAHLPTGSGVAVIGVSSTQLPGNPVIAFPAGGPASPTDASTGQVYLYPDPSAPTVYGVYPMITGSGTTWSSVAGQVVCYGNRILCLAGVNYGYPAGGGFDTNENINFTDPPQSASFGFQQTVLEAEDPYGYGGASSVSAGELFLIKKRGGGLFVTGDIFSPAVTYLPGVQSTGGMYGRAGAGTAGVFYCSLQNGAWLWNGGNTAQKISTQLDENFFVPPEFTTMGGNNYGYFVECIGDKAYFSNNWLYDMTLGSWWKYFPDESQNGRNYFWVNPVSGRYIYAGVLSFTGTGVFMAQFDTQTPAQTYQWCSLPLALASPFQVSDIREVVIIASCTATNCAITVSILDNNTEVAALTMPTTVTQGPEIIRFILAAKGVQKPQVRIQVINANPGDMAVIHDIGILFDTRAPETGDHLMALDVYSCGLGSNHVTPIDTGTNTPGTNIHISSALDVAVTPDGTKAYVAQNGSLVTTIITATQTIGTTITGIIGTCIGVGVTPDGTTCVVVTDAPEMVLIDVATDTITTQIPITAGGTPTGMALTSDGLNVYSVSAAGPSVNLVQTTIPGGVSTLTAGVSGTPAAFAGIALSPDDTMAYIVTDVGNPGTLSQFSIPSGTPGASVTVGDSPTGVAITPDGTECWVCNYADGTISVVAIPAMTISATISTVYATGSWDLCFLPDQSAAYVTNKDNSRVLPIALPSEVVGTAIVVSGDPWGIGTTPPAAPTPAPTRPGAPIPGPNYNLFIPRKHEVDLAHQSNYHAIENWANNLPLAAARNRVGFFGVTPVQRQSSAGIATVADLVAVLQNYGLLD